MRVGHCQAFIKNPDHAVVGVFLWRCEAPITAGTVGAALTARLPGTTVAHPGVSQTLTSSYDKIPSL